MTPTEIMVALNDRRQGASEFGKLHSSIGSYREADRYFASACAYVDAMNLLFSYIKEVQQCLLN